MPAPTPPFSPPPRRRNGSLPRAAYWRKSRHPALRAPSALAVPEFFFSKTISEDENLQGEKGSRGCRRVYEWESSEPDQTICQSPLRAFSGRLGGLRHLFGSIAAAEKHSNAPWSTPNGTGLSLLSAMSPSSGAAGGNLSCPVVPSGGGYCLRNLPLPLTLGHAVPKASEDRLGPRSGRL